MDSSSALSFAGFALACIAAASTGALFKPGDWYESLDRPPWRPPNWLFGPAWAVLYTTIAVAAWWVWGKAGFAGAAVPLTIWAIQLVLNAAWSWLFFGLRRPDLAFIELIALWLSIAATIVAFHTVEPAAAWLLLPYLGWVAFAGVLNLSISRRNPRSARGQAAA